MRESLEQMIYYKRITIEGVTNGLLMLIEEVDATGKADRAPVRAVYQTVEDMIIGLRKVLVDDAK